MSRLLKVVDQRVRLPVQLSHPFQKVHVRNVAVAHDPLVRIHVRWIDALFLRVVVDILKPVPSDASRVLQQSQREILIIKPAVLLCLDDPFMGTGLGDDENIDWTTVSVSLPTAGTYTLGFEISDYDPVFGSFESILGVDNVSVVPLPSALVLGSLGLGVAGSLVGRFQRRRTRQ